jgi:hypothetical protein
MSTPISQLPPKGPGTCLLAVYIWIHHWQIFKTDSILNITEFNYTWTCEWVGVLSICLSFLFLLHLSQALRKWKQSNELLEI